MIRTLAPIIILSVLMAACSKQPRKPIGMASWDEVKTAAQQFVFNGNVAALRAHCDFSGIPPETLQELNTRLDGWHGVLGNLKHLSTAEVSLEDYEVMQKDFKKNLPEFLRNLPSRTKWNVRPDKVIVFSFVSKDPNDTNTLVRWSAGAYQTNALWFFVSCYME